MSVLEGMSCESEGKHKKVLMLRCQGGFANRFRAIASAALWAEDLGRRLAIYWPVERGHMPCRLEDLLVPESIPGFCCAHAGYLPKAHACQSVTEFEAVLAAFGPEAEEIRIESYANFHPELVLVSARGEAMFRCIQIQAALEGRAEMLWKDRMGGREAVGAHFRGTDHRKCLAATPAAVFEKAVLEVEDEPLVFLATDELTMTYRLLKALGPSRLRWAFEGGGRTWPEDQKHGIVDWLLLQKCQRIIGSYGSSFSETAALRAGISLTCPTQAT